MPRDGLADCPITVGPAKPGVSPVASGIIYILLEKISRLAPLKGFLLRDSGVSHSADQRSNE